MLEQKIARLEHELAHAVDARDEALKVYDLLRLRADVAEKEVAELRKQLRCPRCSR